MAAGMCHHHRIFRKCGIQYKTVGMLSLFQIIVVISRSDNPVAGFQLSLFFKPVKYPDNSIKAFRLLQHGKG